MNPRPKNDQTMELVLVTPALALEWLTDKNKINRPLSNHHTAKLANDMVNGRWLNTSTPIVFDREGYLIDGQHRLTAIFDTDSEFYFWVARNRDPEEREVIDVGRSRSLADLMSYDAGIPRQYSKYIATASRAMFIGMDSARGTEATKTFLLDFTKEHLDAFVWYFRNIPAQEGDALTHYEGSVVANVVRAYYHVKEKVRLVSFMDILHTGLYDSTDPSTVAVINLRNAMMSERSFSRTLAPSEAYGRVQRVLLAYIKKEKLSRIASVTKEHWPLLNEGEIVKRISTAPRPASVGGEGKRKKQIILRERMK